MARQPALAYKCLQTPTNSCLVVCCKTAHPVCSFNPLVGKDYDFIQNILGCNISEK